MSKAKHTELQEAVDKSWPVYRFMIVASSLIVLSIAGAFVGGAKWMESITPEERTSSFVGYSQSCWQVGDTLTVITAKGDTVGFDLSKFEQNETNTTTSH